MAKDMLHDPRTIKAVWVPGEEGEGWIIGRGKVDKIEVYGEPGQEAFVPWFAIWVDGKISQRVNAAMIENVVYKEEPC